MVNAKKEIDEKAIRIVSAIRKRETELIDTLQKAERLRVFEDFGLTSLFAYCTTRLGLSEDRAFTYIKVARVAVKLSAPSSMEPDSGVGIDAGYTFITGKR